DGYRIGSKEIFCPWDVTCYVSDLLKPRASGPESFAPPAYWNNTSNSRIITQYMPNLDNSQAIMLQDLLDGRSVGVRVHEDMSYGDFDLSDAGQFWNLLVYTGYLTLDKRGTDDVYCFRIPNAEIRKCFDSNIMAYYHKKGGAYFENYSKAIAEALLDGSAERLSSALDDALLTFVSARDVAGKEPKENYYHGLLNGIILSAGDLFKDHSSNTDSGDSYADITLRSAKHNVAVVIELKYAASRAELKDKAREALRQIIDKDYAEAVRDDSVHRIFGFGIAFFHRKCAVEAAELPL
ncbi:MAG: PD-(D/E)XK nuclease domain-containing protein, partial [Oscillospiraceae bacterium]|nr:PD-(D/E)XK nuclease domain-containing protein [Oscillospiraceae bacterium]